MLLNKEKAYEYMRDANLDALVLAYTENVVYFGDFLEVNSNRLKTRLYFLVFFRDANKEPVYLVPHQDFDDAKRQSWIEDIRPTAEYRIDGRPEVIFEKEKEVAQAIRDRGLESGTIGYEDGSLPVATFERLQAHLAGFKFQGATDLLRRLRAVKSGEELRRIRRAMDITQEGARAILRAAAPGVTEAELASKARQACMEAGADYVDFLIVGTAENGAIVHGAPTDRPLKDGDIVRFDLGAVYEGYPGDFARTFVVGSRASDRDAMHYGAVRAAVEAGVAAVRPGVTAGEVFAAQMEAGRAIDPDLTREHAGHGVGLEIHEEPMVYADSDFVLEEGMLVMIESGRYILGQAGYQLEDLVLVTADGHEMLTSVPRDLVLEG